MEKIHPAEKYDNSYSVESNKVSNEESILQLLYEFYLKDPNAYMKKSEFLEKSGLDENQFIAVISCLEEKGLVEVLWGIKDYYKSPSLSRITALGILYITSPASIPTNRLTMNDSEEKYHKLLERANNGIIKF